jgi:tellurite resistance protein TerC
MHDAFHVPVWLWIVALGVVLAVAGGDLLFASRSRGHEPGLREAALCTAGVVALGALFGLALAAVAGPKASGQFYAGWLTEYSLSLDNLFVFVLLIGRSGVAAQLRSRVLLAGIGLALLLRAVFIAAGAAALNRFDWVLYIFGAVLLVTAVRMAAGRAGPPDPTSAGPSMPGPEFMRRGLADRLRRHPHGALLALIAAIAGADLVFAMDSIPAVFGLTRDPYLVLAANVFALLGLRHLYFLIGGLLDRGAVRDPRVHRAEADRRGALRFRGAPDRARASAERRYLGVPGRHRRRARRGHGDQPGIHPAPPGRRRAQPFPVSSPS